MPKDSMTYICNKHTVASNVHLSVDRELGSFACFSKLKFTKLSLFIWYFVMGQSVVVSAHFLRKHKLLI